MIGFSPILDKNISNSLVKVADKNNIKYQREIMAGSTGTNADVITLSEKGIKGGLISIPEKYMHQPCEVVDIDDIVRKTNSQSGVYQKIKYDEDEIPKKKHKSSSGNILTKILYFPMAIVAFALYLGLICLCV